MNNCRRYIPGSAKEAREARVIGDDDVVWHDGTLGRKVIYVRAHITALI